MPDGNGTVATVTGRWGSWRDHEIKAQRGIGTARRGTSIRGPGGWAGKAGT